MYQEQPCFFPKNSESLFSTRMGQDGLVFDDVGWWRGLNKCVDSILTLSQVLSALWRAWKPTIWLLQILKRQLAHPSQQLMAGVFCIKYPIQSGGKTSFSTSSFSESTPSFSASTHSIPLTKYLC